jgi:hypothetical protein
MYYMMLNLLNISTHNEKAHAILDGGKWFTIKDAEELQGEVYEIIKHMVLVEWKKEFANRDEIVYEKPC